MPVLPVERFVQRLKETERRLVYERPLNELGKVVFINEALKGVQTQLKMKQGLR